MRRTVSEVVERYLMTLRCKRPESVWIQTKPVIRLLGEHVCDELRGYHTSDYRSTRRAEGVSDATINRELSYLKAALRQALEDERISRVPRIRMAREPPPRQGFVSRQALEKICEHLSDDLADVVRFAFLTGWRRAAILGLTWDDVADAVVTLPAARSKGGVAVRFPVLGEVKRIIDRRRARSLELGQSDPHVFLRGARPIKDFSKAWRKACRAAGHPGLLVHDLRRSMAYHQMRAGVPRHVTMRLAGWRTESVYTRYAICDEAALEAGARQAQQYLFAPSSRRRRRRRRRTGT